MKKPSVKGMKNMGYLGHFAKDKFLSKGHNFSGSPSYNEKRDWWSYTDNTGKVIISKDQEKLSDMYYEQEKSKKLKEAESD